MANPLWFQRVENGLLEHKDDNSTVFHPLLTNDKYLVNSTVNNAGGTNTGSSSSSGSDSGSSGSSSDSTALITAAMITAAVKSAGGSTANMVWPAQTLADMMNSAFANYAPGQLRTKKQAACFVGECAQETAWFQTMKEYGGASTSYAPYYGRGMIQLTWQSNYQAFGTWVNNKSANISSNNVFVDSPDLVATQAWAAVAGVYYFTQKYWNGKNLMTIADASSSPWLDVSRAINMGNPYASGTPYGATARANAINAALAVAPDPTTSGSSGSSGSTSGTTPKDDYPYPNATIGTPDPWSFYYRECVSFACWRVRSRSKLKTFTNFWGKPATNGRWGNANTWDTAARDTGVPIDTKPAVGSVAQRNSGSAGHVAWVNKVYSDGSFDVEEYNHDWTNGYGHVYGTRHVNPATASTSNHFDYFIHFEKM